MGRVIFCSVCILVFEGASFGQGAADADPKALKLKEMTVRAGLLKMAYRGDSARPAPRLGTAPILRCDDPTREEVDGTIWLWTAENRPVAILGLQEVRKEWSYEHLSLIDESIEVTGRPNWTWRPKALQRAWITLADQVPETSAARQRVLREIARQFEASETYDGQTFQLRLLTRPVYSYSVPDQGVLDGALFVLANGTNPEVVLQIEARKTAARSEWVVTFGRLTAAAASAIYQKKEVWKADQIGPWSPEASYYSYHGPDALD